MHDKTIFLEKWDWFNAMQRDVYSVTMYLEYCTVIINQYHWGYCRMSRAIDRLPEGTTVSVEDGSHLMTVLLGETSRKYWFTEFLVVRYSEIINNFSISFDLEGRRYRSVECVEGRSGEWMDGDWIEWSNQGEERRTCRCTHHTIQGLVSTVTLHQIDNNRIDWPIFASTSHRFAMMILP